jgi:hypothetical protein
LIELGSVLGPQKIGGFVQQEFPVRNELSAFGICGRSSFRIAVEGIITSGSQKMRGRTLLNRRNSEKEITQPTISSQKYFSPIELRKQSSGFCTESLAFGIRTVHRLLTVNVVHWMIHCRW